MSNIDEMNSNLILEKIAINMLKEKLGDALIKSVTGFSQEIIDKLKNKM